MDKRKVLILGAAGRDFHNFNVYYKDNPYYEVVAFTATQIPNIEGRIFPASLAGQHYPDGIPIFKEDNLEELIKRFSVDEVVFAYSDVSHNYVMNIASRVMSSGASFVILGPDDTMLKSKLPVIAVCAVRTGAGKSPTSRKVSKILKEMGKSVAVIRHPMPYSGNLELQKCQRFSSFQDMDAAKCTFEEREEYEPHIEIGNVVFVGVDYKQILANAEKEADVILWDGGNNDIPFIKPDLLIVLVDPHRPGHEITYHPGETNLRMADVIIINKIATARPEAVLEVRKNIFNTNPAAEVIEATLPIFIENWERIRDKRVLAIEDGPTITHGEMPYGAGVIAARRYQAKELVDPRLSAPEKINKIYEKFPHIGPVLPAMGYDKEQIAGLEETINNSDADLVLSATPIDLARLLNVNKPVLRVRYELSEIGTPNLVTVLTNFFNKLNK